MFSLRTIFIIDFFTKDFLAMLYDIIFTITMFLILISVISFIMVTYSSPGYIKSNNITLLQLMDKYRSQFICPYCEVVKRYHTRHCHLCKKCIKVFFI